jgi:hypothetical protein
MRDLGLLTHLARRLPTPQNFSLFFSGQSRACTIPRGPVAEELRRARSRPMHEDISEDKGAHCLAGRAAPLRSLS